MAIQRVLTLIGTGENRKLKKILLTDTIPEENIPQLGNLSKLPNIPSGKMLARTTAGTGAVELIDIPSISVNDALSYKGAINASTNPNYPAADAGDTYRISVAGKIGGGSGPNVEIGDMLICNADSTAAGNHATVGANWNIIQVNVDGAVTGQSSSVDSELALFSGTSGKVIKRATGNGIPKLASGVLSLVTAPTGAIVGDADTQTLTNKTLSAPTITGAIALPDNTRQTFNPGANAAGLNVGAHTADPDTLSNGDLWYNSTSNQLKARINGATVALGAGGGGSSYDESNPILDSSSNELVEFEKALNAVNNLKLKNNSTGNSPEIIAVGFDTNISVVARGKGNGGFISKSFVRATGEWNTNPTIFEAVSSSDDTTQKLKIFINGGDSKWINFQPASTGGLILEGFTTLGSNGLQNTAQTMANTGDVGRVNFAIRAIASQTANLLDFRNSSDTVIAGFDKNAAWKPPSLANSAAPNNSVYYSSDASKLVYKDSGGTVNNLY